MLLMVYITYNLNERKEGAMKNLLICLLLILMLTSCADYVTFEYAAHYDPVGFWYGLWHGMILPFAWLVSLFNDNTAIYAIYNNGGWYDFGFILGCGGALSGGGAAAS